MATHYTVTIGILVVLSICFQVRNAAPTNEATAEETTCPRFQTRTENGSLIVMYQASNELCEMVVTTETVQLRPSTQLKAFKKKHRTIRRPLVSFRNGSNFDGEFPCNTLTHSSIGPFAFVNTVPNQCQMLFRIHKMKNHHHGKMKPEPKVKGNKKGKKKGEKREKPKKTKKYHFIPVFEYIDEVLY
ncbi:uncharacterized protein [Argopecten irradians]|uniref:uncharacterized protein n=1 Tax=Argopecten irradians TaxID=31199 RepID=UPI003719F4FC